MKYLNRAFFLCLTTITVHYAVAQSLKNTHVVIDPGGHMASIKSLDFSPDGKLLYSVSDDKTIRVWDVERKELIQTFRGYIENGNIGMFNSSALNPNGKFLAVAGFLGSAGKNSGDIRYINTETGEVVYVFEGHTETVVSLDISKDGKFMASGTSNGILGIWSLSNGQGARVRAHTDGIYGLAFSPNGKQLISVSYDSTVRVWDMSSLLEKGQFDYSTLREHSDKVRSVCYAPNGEFFITVGYDNKIIKYDSNAQFVKVIKEIKDPNGYDFLGDLHTVSISSNSKTIVVGTRLFDNSNTLSIDVETAEIITRFKLHDNTVMASDFHGNSLVATAGGTNRDIFVWNPETGDVKAHFVGKGQRIWKVAAGPNNLIGFSTEGKKVIKVNEHGELNKLFNLNTMEYIGEHDDFSGFYAEREDTLDYTLTQMSAFQIAVSSAKGNSFIELDPGADGRINCFSLTPDEHIIVGTNFGLNLFDVNGKRVRRYEGHLNDVYSVAFSEDGRFMYSGSGDQSIRIWDLKDEGKYRRTFNEYVQELKDYYGDSVIMNLFDTKGESFFKDLYHENEFPTVYPKASIFVSKDDDWIIWTDQHYYAASKGGSHQVGFQKTQGEDSSAIFYTFEQFDIQLNRPDKVLDILEIDNDELKVMYAQAYQKRLGKLGLNESTFNTNINAPTIEVNTPNQTVDKAYFGFNNQLYDMKHGILAEHVTINGVPIYGIEGLQVGGMMQSNSERAATMVSDIMHTTLVPGKNKIQIWCTNSLGVESNRETRYIYFDTAEVKPDLYILGIGASIYKDNKFNLKYAAKDVRDFVTLQTQNKVYGHVYIDTLMNENVSPEALQEAIKRLNKAKVYDHVMIYYAGHGLLTEDLNYYLAAYNIKFKDPTKGGLDYTYLEKEVGKLRARTRTVYIDACHSGEVDKENTKLVSTTNEGTVVRHDSRGLVVTSTGLEQSALFELINDMYSDLRNNSGATIIASAGGAEFAYEGADWNNGVFTYSILKGIRSKEADLNADGYIYLSELQSYVRDHVVTLTNGLQQPTNRFNNIHNDHVIWQY